MVQRGFDHDAEPANACWFLNALLARSDLGLYIIDHSVQESEVTCAGCMGDFQENPVRAVMSLPVPRTKSVPTLSTRAGSSRQFCEAFPVAAIAWAKSRRESPLPHYRAILQRWRTSRSPPGCGTPMSRTSNGRRAISGAASRGSTPTRRRGSAIACRCLMLRSRSTAAARGVRALGVPVLRRRHQAADAGGVAQRLQSGEAR